MVAKQCSKCGRFKGTATHVCATSKVKNTAVVPSVPQKVKTPTAPIASNPDKPVRPNAKKVAAILQDAAKLQNTIKALEVAIYSKNENSDLRIKLEATFGKIDWNA